MEAERTGAGCRMPSDIDVKVRNGCMDWIGGEHGMETGGGNRKWRGGGAEERQKDTKREGEGGAWQ